MERRKLEGHEVEERLAELDGWRLKEDKIKKSFKFDNFDVRVTRR